LENHSQKNEVTTGLLGIVDGLEPLSRLPYALWSQVVDKVQNASSIICTSSHFCPAATYHLVLFCNEIVDSCRRGASTHMATRFRACRNRIVLSLERWIDRSGDR
jgi:hypothetical protein